MTRHAAYILWILLFIIGPVWPESSPRGSVVDNRVRTLVYGENQVYKLTAYFGYQIDIQIDEKEEVRTIASGDTVGWQIVNAGQHLFIKPMAQDARTNLSVVTSKRTYIFDLTAQAALDRDNITYLVRFKYPDTTTENILISSSRSGPESYNFDYQCSGAAELKPLKVFDDGQFTFFQFETTRDQPAIFLVGSDGQESLVNFRMEGKYTVVERLGDFFTLRSGKQTATVINQSKLPAGAVAEGDSHGRS